jgi:hypothetical protein
VSMSVKPFDWFTDQSATGRLPAQALFFYGGKVDWWLKPHLL